MFTAGVIVLVFFQKKLHADFKRINRISVYVTRRDGLAFAFGRCCHVVNSVPRRLQPKSAITEWVCFAVGGSEGEEGVTNMGLTSRAFTSGQNLTFDT